jgi:hypothetical protein
MSCREYEDALADLAAGGARPDVEAHVDTCAGCRAELEALRRALRVADSALQALVAVEPRPGLHDRIRRAAAEADESRQRSWAGRPLAWTTALGGSLVAAALLVGLWRSRTTPMTPPSVPSTTAAERRLEPVPVPVPEGRPSRRGKERQAAPAVPPRAPAPKMALAEPEVLVPPGEAEALLRFAASLQERAVAPGSLLVSGPGDRLVEPRGIDLVPLETVTLDSSWESDLEEGARP